MPWRLAGHCLGEISRHWLYHSCEVCTKQAQDELPSCYGLKNPSATTYCRSVYDGCECYVMKGENIKTCANYESTYVYWKCCNGYYECKPCEDANKDCSQMDPCAPPKNETATKK
ncbi:unnamed protein product [Symbiodinium sp. CCMP2592]|nr:unnamed protein product [Symbiodinium sp. CCMP2592]